MRRFDTPHARRGRGAQSNRSGRFETLQRIDIDDGWEPVAPPPGLVSVGGSQGEPALRTGWRVDAARTVITRNNSPDLHFDRSINPYRGCEHGCVYCYARPSHAFLGHSPGLDFERLLYAKPDAPQLLRRELNRRGYRCAPIALGVNTDAYQPLERELEITRGILKVLLEARHPVYLITKSGLIERDIDLLSALAKQNLVTVTVTVTTLDNQLSHQLEPRASAPHRRLRTLRTLHAAGIPTRVSVSPVIPALNEHELDDIIEATAAAGIIGANAILLRLPHELGDLFSEWLDEFYPMRKARILKAIRSMRSDRLNDSGFGTRFLGEGPRAMLIQARFERACRRHGVRFGREVFTMDCDRFQPPALPGSSQLPLFDDSVVS